MARAGLPVLTVLAASFVSCAGYAPDSSRQPADLTSWVGQYSGAGCLRMKQSDSADATGLSAGMRWFGTVLELDGGGSGPIPSAEHDELCRTGAAFRLRQDEEAATVARPSHPLPHMSATSEVDTVFAGQSTVSITQADGQLRFAASLIDADGRVHRLVGEPVALEPSGHVHPKVHLPAGALVGHAAVGDHAHVTFTLIREQQALRGTWRLFEPDEPGRGGQGEVAFAFLDLRQE